MKTALVIPTLNAAKKEKWQEVLAAIAMQDFALTRKIIIDSSSDDETCAIAKSFGWECRRIERREFNHGRTRDAIVTELAQTGIDMVAFLSQDVILADPDALREITGFLWNNSIAGCFGMQRACNEHSLNAWQRMRCYPEKSEIRTMKDVHERGMTAVFFSNAFSAWKTAEVIRYGGFPETDFGEDTLLAAGVLNQGGSVGYCAEAVAFHDHPNTPAAIFLRGMQIGVFHRKHPELLRLFGKKRISSQVSIPWSIWVPLAIKVIGYVCGRIGNKLIPWGLFLLMWILLLPAIFSYDFPQRDVAGRYAPMAEAFARGNWQYAFHPRITPLLTVCAGIISFIFACNGYFACQMASSLLLTIGIFPFYSGCRKIYGEKTAIVSGLLYALCPPFLRLGYYGIRETGSILGIVLLFCSTAILWKQCNKLLGFLLFAAAEVILLLSRGDAALFALIAALILFVRDIFRNHVPWRSILAGTAISIVLLPQLLYNYRIIGYPVPEVRHAAVLQKICRRIPFLKCLQNPHPSMLPDIPETADE